MRVAGVGVSAGAVLFVAAPASGVLELGRRIQNAKTGWCMEGMADGHAYAFTCRAEKAAQLWTLPPGESGFLVRNVVTSRCLDTDIGGTLYANRCADGSAYQRWNWIEASGSWALLRDTGSGMCLTGGGNKVVNAGVCDASDSYQRFALLN